MVLRLNLVPVLIVLLHLSYAQLAVERRVDCHPDPDANQANCETRGCIYEETAEPGPPWCYYPSSFGYQLFGELQITEQGFTAELVKSGPPTFVPNEFNIVTLEVEYQTNDRLRIKLHPNFPRYEVPISIPADPIPPINMQYEVQTSRTPVFSFRVVRKSTGSVLFDSALGGLTLADQFLQIGFEIPSFNLYGFGEHEHPSMRHNMSWNTWGMFTNDFAPDPYIGLYGVHPHYTVLEDDGKAHSVLFLNSNAQEVALTPAPGIIYRTIGGVLDMYFFLGPTPENSVQQYTAAIGRMPLPAYWNLGFHLCRWGYEIFENMQAAYNRTKEAGIPQESQWSDIDFLDRRLVFTYDSVNWAELPAFIDHLHANGQRFVPILDPGIPTGEPEGTYPPFDTGNEMGIWVLNASGSPIEGQVWPDNPTRFPDFSNPATSEWWLQAISDWRDLLGIDGVWIDMNEPSSFILGSTLGCENNKYTNPPYLPDYGRPDINEKTLCMDAVHVGGLHYDTHSMYGWWEAKVTQSAIRQAFGERSLSLTRSSFVGTGNFAAHWLGDNWSQWDNLKTSIIGIMEMNQFGIPLVGADICGFIGDTTEELCARWHLLGAFYPFSRNHNTLGAIDQDPGLWPSVAANAQKALLIKYALLPYLYTLFYRHAISGDTVVRPLWHEFSTDPTTWDIDEQFLWGTSFMVSPVLNQGQTAVNAYIPDGLWYDYYTGTEVPVSQGYLNIDCPLDCIPLHVRGGIVIPTQEPAMTTSLARLNNFGLIVALDDTGNAGGELYWDDGVTVDDQLLLGSLIQYSASNNQLSATVLSSSFSELGNLKVSSIQVWGVSGTVTEVLVNDASLTNWSQNEAILDVQTEDMLSALSEWTVRWTVS